MASFCFVVSFHKWIEPDFDLVRDISVMVIGSFIIVSIELCSIVKPTYFDGNESREEEIDYLLDERHWQNCENDLYVLGSLVFICCGLSCR